MLPFLNCNYMDINEKLERLRLVYEIFQLDALIKEYEQKMEEKDGPGQCDQTDPEIPEA